MKVSIAMATYNGASYLVDQLYSIAQQTRLPDELIICDDFSSDDTVAILERFRDEVPFLVHIYKGLQNVGYVRTFEKALSLCTGDIVFLSDQDDVWFENKISEMLRIFNEHQNIYVLVADMVITDQNLRPSPYTQLRNHLSIGLPKRDFGPGCATALRREFLDIVLPIPVELSGHDGWIHKLASAMNVKLIYPQALQYYRRHRDASSDSLTNRPVKTTSLAFVRAYGLVDASEDWRQTITEFRAALRRLDNSASELNRLNLAMNAECGKKRIVRQISHYERRIRLVEEKRIFRTASVSRFWLDGGYGSFSGWRSALKDILR